MKTKTRMTQKKKCSRDAWIRAKEEVNKRLDRLIQKRVAQKQSDLRI